MNAARRGTRWMWLALLAGCALAPVPGMPTTSDQGREGSGLPPAGFGTLRQDEISLDLRSGVLQVKVTPLAESVIRVTAPDTYQRLAGLVRAHQPEVARSMGSTARAATLFLVSLFSDAPGVVFTPEEIQIVSGGRRLRPSVIVPVTPGWNRHRLEQRETEMALYAFPSDVELESDLVVGYGSEESRQWSLILPRIQAERARARARAGGGRGSSTGR